MTTDRGFIVSCDPSDVSNPRNRKDRGLSFPPARLPALAIHSLIRPWGGKDWLRSLPWCGLHGSATMNVLVPVLLLHCPVAATCMVIVVLCSDYVRMLCAWYGSSDLRS
jgi:hypothetical protein